MDTKTINLRDIPGELVRRAKVCAALNGLTLRDFVIRAISKATDEGLVGMPMGLAALTEPPTAKKGKKKQ